MDDAQGNAVLERLERRRDEMVELLARLSRAESPTHEPEAVNGAVAILADELEGVGFLVRRLRGNGVGDHLFARPRHRRRGAPHQVLIGHVDTVWPLGTVQTMPVRLVGDALHGPGVYDMKGGLVQAVFALRALADLGLRPSVTPVVLINSDEETGSRTSSPVIRRLARGAARAFVLEPADGEAGKLKTGRKGVGRFEIRVSGRASHAGGSFEEGISAILELSHQVQRLFALNDPGRGITVNVGTIDGGLRPNVVAPEAWALVDVRAPTRAAARDVEREIKGLRPTLPGSRVEVEGGFGRQPMESSPRNRRLYETARRLGETLGVELPELRLAGGGSDANTTSQLTATLDGLGPVGAGAHAADEHVLVSSMPVRAALLALLLLQPAEARVSARSTPARRRRAQGSSAPSAPSAAASSRSRSA
jgi:glutamate carboxypeptidase